jgi:hypothetical protein
MRRRPHSRCRRERCGAITVAKTRAKAFGVSATSRETRVEVPSKSKRAGRRRRSGSSDEVSKRIVPRWRTLKRLYMSRSRRFSSKFPRGVDLTKASSNSSIHHHHSFRRRFRFSFRFRAQEAQAEGCGQESSRRLRVVPANMTTCHPYAHLGKRVAARLEGRSAGTCHKCGASLNSPFPRARYCERCGTLYHTYDCGKRLSSLHISTAPVECPKVCPSHSKGGVTT